MERRGLHITNTVIVGITLFFFALAFIGAFFFSLAIGSSSNYFGASGTSIVLIFFIVSTTYFIFLLYSFKKRNLDNTLFKWADSINLIGFFGSVLFVIILMIYLSIAAAPSMDFNLLDRANAYLDVLTWIGGIIYSISFIVFLIGYFTSEKKLKVQAQTSF